MIIVGIVGLGACLYRVIWPSTLVRLLKLRALNVDTILLFLTLITPLPRSTLNMEPKQEKILSRKEIHHQELADQGIEGGISKRLLWINLWSAAGALNYGFAASIIGSSLGQPKLLAYLADDFAKGSMTGDIGAIVGMFNVGGFFGVVLVSYISDRWGRKAGFILAVFFSVLGAGLGAGATNLVMLILGRLFSGVGSWASLFSAIIFQGECAPTTRRGLLGGIIGPSVTCGYILASWIGLGFFYMENGANWRIPLALQALPAIILVAFLPWMPESPRWLAFVKRAPEALDVLKRLHYSQEDPSFIVAREEAYQIVAQVTVDQTFPSGWIYLFRHHWREALLAILVCTANQITGLQVITNYGPTIYASLGFSSAMALVLAGAWVSMGVCFGFFCSFIIDKVGRRPLLIWPILACGAMMACEVGLIGAFLDSDNLAGKRACIAFFFLFLIPYEFNEPVMFLYISELLPVHLRAKGIAIGLATINIHSVWITEAQPTGVARIGYKFYIIFPCLCIITTVMSYFWVVETKGVPLEEIGMLFGHASDVAVHAADIHLDDAGNIVDNKRVWQQEAESQDTAA